MSDSPPASKNRSSERPFLFALWRALSTTILSGSLAIGAYAWSRNVGSWAELQPVIRETTPLLAAVFLFMIVWNYLRTTPADAT